MRRAAPAGAVSLNIQAKSPSATGAMHRAGINVGIVKVLQANPDAKLWSGQIAGQLLEHPALVHQQCLKLAQEGAIVMHLQPHGITFALKGE
jgi:hypothetical protein